MMYTVKQLADLAGVSRRTLHYYHEKGLLEPDRINDNGYRYYNDSSAYRLQQILLYREMGLELSKIKSILDNPRFDTLLALRNQRNELGLRIRHYRKLISCQDRCNLIVGIYEVQYRIPKWSST